MSEMRRTNPPDRYVPIDLVLGPTSNLGRSNLNTRRGSYDAWCQSCPFQYEAGGGDAVVRREMNEAERMKRGQGVRGRTLGIDMLDGIR